MSHAGAVTLLRTAEVTGFTTALSHRLSSWRKPLPQFDPGKIATDLAVSLALGGDCLADIATLREHTAVFGRVSSDPAVPRLITALAAGAPAVLTAIGRKFALTNLEDSDDVRFWDAGTCVDSQAC